MPAKVKTPKVELLINPYGHARGGPCVRDALITELDSGKWKRFRAAVAFAQETGNDLRLISAMKAFADRGNDIQVTFGADTFANGGAGSEYAALEYLISELTQPSVKFFLYREPKRTFHPKIYLFDILSGAKSLAIIGSSNWSVGGHVNNVEANVLLRLGSTANDAKIYRGLCELFEQYWQE